MTTPPRALTIAGSDSGGGAGIQADLKTFSALGCYGMSAVTALTAQNTIGVTGIHAVPAAFVAAQIDAVLGDIGADAVKIGMLQDAEIIRAVAERLRAHAVERIVLDPVMVAKSGDRLLREDAVAALREELLPMATVLTPNLPEAEILAAIGSIEGRPGMERAAGRLHDLGPAAVLVKGGHGEGATSADCLVYRDPDGATRSEWFEAERIATPNTHGTGCTLSSAIAAHLARGLGIEAAVREAKGYLTAAIAAGARLAIGHGHGPVDHFHAWR